MSKAKENIIHSETSQISTGAYMVYDHTEENMETNSMNISMKLAAIDISAISIMTMILAYLWLG